MKATVCECYNANTYQVEGYRFRINSGNHIIVSKPMYKIKSNCVKALRNTMKEYNIKMCDNFIIHYTKYDNLKFLV